MKLKYIALDFDGTILNDKHQISKDLVLELKRLQDLGIKIILCSGRDIAAMQSVIKKLNVLSYDTYIVSSNGGEIYQASNNEMNLIKRETISQEKVLKLYRMLGDKTRHFYSYNGKNVEMSKFNLSRCLLAIYLQGTIRFRVNSEATKLIIMDSEEHINSIFSDVKTEILSEFPDFNVFRSVKKGIEITPKLSTKGQALKTIFSLNNWDNDALISFGDGENDIDMFEFSKIAVAMENAFDSTKTYATHFTKTNNENGVYDFIINNNNLFN